MAKRSWEQHSWGEIPGILSKAIRAGELRDGGVREGIRESVLSIWQRSQL